MLVHEYYNIDREISHLEEEEREEIIEEARSLIQKHFGKYEDGAVLVLHLLEDGKTESYPVALCWYELGRYEISAPSICRIFTDPQDEDEEPTDFYKEPKQKKKFLAECKKAKATNKGGSVTFYDLENFSIRDDDYGDAYLTVAMEESGEVPSVIFDCNGEVTKTYDLGKNAFLLPVGEELKL